MKSTVLMTRLALPGMLERKRGAIVNFASGAALNPCALLTGYSGAKGFILVRDIAASYPPAPFCLLILCFFCQLLFFEGKVESEACWS